MRLTGLVALATVCLSPPQAASAQEGCFGAGQPLFHCRAGARTVDLCLQGEVLLYRFGAPGRPAEMLLARPVTRVDMRPWSGMGRYLNEAVTLSNGAVSYTIRYSIDRLAESGPATQGSVGVAEGGRGLGEVVCDAGSVSLSDFYPVFEAKERAGQCWGREAERWGWC